MRTTYSITQLFPAKGARMPLRRDRDRVRGLLPIRNEPVRNVRYLHDFDLFARAMMMVIITSAPSAGEHQLPAAGLNPRLVQVYAEARDLLRSERGTALGCGRCTARGDGAHGQKENVHIHRRQSSEEPLQARKHHA